MKSKVNPLVNLNVNPCKMCMPMGVGTAFYGIKNCISILHGSQGCATYIRRHMATHYNEPVDIASSSLTEQGTVYGGENNLKKGLKNLIEIYKPEVVGVASTCLAETIGEDLARIIDNFRRENPKYKQIEIIPVHSAGYGGTQFEGYFHALFSIVSNVKMDMSKIEKVNVVTSLLSPADIRHLKDILDAFELQYILLPDISDNLDGGYQETYQRLPDGGTSISDIRKMAGARCTIELTNVSGRYSPGKYLFETYNVPYIPMNIPVGLRDTDALLQKLSEITGKAIPETLLKERARYLDAMIDCHKYNAEGRAAIYGEPDFVVSMVRLCVENGVIPVLAATGSATEAMNSLIEEEISTLARKCMVENYKILNNVDFKEIEFYAKELQVTMLIGNSDGRRLEEELQLPLIRRSFPIHDRMGGQRTRTIGYEGSMNLMNEIANTVLVVKETTFRERLFQQLYKDTLMAKEGEEEKRKNDIVERTKTHPCYNCDGHKYARMHLPVAPKCNIQCNYCIRKFDCPNESRPGVTTKVLTPEEAFEKFKLVKNKIPNLTVVGIAGPGDALANFEETKRTMELIREYDSNITFCLSTNGLMLPTYAMDIIDLGVTHVTVTVNAVDAKIGGKIYKYIHYMGARLEGEAAGAVILSNQLAGLRILTAHNIICKVNIVYLKGINDTHIKEIVSKVKSMGCYITNIMPMIPVKGSGFEHNEVASHKEIEAIRSECGEILLQMTHCKQCRADAIGTLDNDVSLEYRENKTEQVCQIKIRDEEELWEKGKLRFAVASHSGMLIDQHFGHVTQWYIYDYEKDCVKFIAKREVEHYCMGSEQCEEEEKLNRIIRAVWDCDGVISMRIGESPRLQLEKKGIEAICTYNRIEAGVKESAKKLLHNKARNKAKNNALNQEEDSVIHMV